MSLINKPAKVKKTENIEDYHKEYRQQHLNHIKNMERVNYYKRQYKLSDDYISKFGEYSARVFKIQQEFSKIKDECPELIEHIISSLN